MKMKKLFPICYKEDLRGLNPHSEIPMDQIMEATINRWSKEMGGLSGKPFFPFGEMDKPLHVKTKK